MSMLKLLERTMEAADQRQSSSDQTCATGLASNPLTQFAVIFCGLIHDVSLDVLAA
jgi:hypothetical protein